MENINQNGQKVEDEEDQSEGPFLEDERLHVVRVDEHEVVHIEFQKVVHVLFERRFTGEDSCLHLITTSRRPEQFLR